jgi:hypothetical protein
LTFAPDEIEASLALNAGIIRSPKTAAIFCGLLIERAKPTALEKVAIVASLALRFAQVLVASFNIAWGDADAEGIGH